MFSLYRILIRLAVAWLAVVGCGAVIGVVIAVTRGDFRDSDWSVAIAIPMIVVGPAFLIGVLAWIIKPVQWTQE
jgi:hypothetical protein